ncbi:MAG: hypothetical protein JXA52_03400 [Planctomycetes bacterium]|nr:hypothetical protein [Planctomycetota bacterium]
MGERSALSGCLLVLLVIVAIAGVYIMVDNFNLLRQSQEETSKAITENTRAITRLRNTIMEGGIALSQSTQTDKKTMPFNNSDLRDPDAEDGGKRVMVSMSFSGNMNHIINNEGTVGDIWAYCNESLGGRNANAPERFEPRLAEWWEISPDGKEILVKLRSGVLWHDFTDPVTKKKWENVPVTSHDFAFYLDTIRNPSLPCDYIRNYYQDLEDIEIIDDLTFKFIWKETYFRSLDFSLGMMPLPRHLYRPDPETTDEEFAEDMLKNKAERNQIIVGCGPYMLDEYIKGDRVILSRNLDYFGPSPYLDRLELREIQDSEKQLIELKRGELDEIEKLNSVQWVEQTKEPDFLTVCDDLTNAEALTRAHEEKKQAARQAGKPFGKHKFEKFLIRRFDYNFIAWNLRKPLFADREVRVALTHCINRKQILQEVFLNIGMEITGPFVPHSLYCDQSIKPWPFDVEKAKEILRNAGWEDTDGDGVIDKDLDGDGKREPFEFTFLMIANHPYQSKWVPMIQEDMKKAGIRMKVTSAEWSVYTEKTHNYAFDACSHYWGGYIETDPYQIWHGSQADKVGSSNICGFNNPEANQIMEEARRTLDLEKRIQLYKRFHRIVHEEQPYTFIHCPHRKFVQSKRYNNAIIYTLGMSGWQWVATQDQQ